MKDKSGIYKWTSPSGKMYIGQAVDLQKRKNMFLNFEHHYAGQKIDNARLKYSHIDDWQYEVLEYCPIEQLDEREIYWIDYYESMIKGYNSQGGGQGHREFSEFTKHKISKSKKSYYRLNPEARHNMSNIKKLYNSRPDVKARFTSFIKEYSNRQDVRKSNSIRVKEYWKKHPNEKKIVAKRFAKKVVQIDMQDNFVKIWDSMSDASRNLGIDKTNISLCCKECRKTSSGYKWKYLDDYNAEQTVLKICALQALMELMKEEAA